MDQRLEDKDNLLKFITQEVEITCRNCKNNQKIMVLYAWVLNILCSHCNNSILDEEIRNKHLPNKIGLDNALFLNAWRLLYDTDRKVNTRQIVMDIYCSMELTLKNKILGHLKRRQVDGDLIEYLIEDNRQRDKTTKLLRALKFRSPDKMESKLQKVRELRNKVVHEGYTPTLEEAKEIVNEVTEIVNKTKPPIPTLRELAALRKYMKRNPFEGVEKQV